MMMMMGGPKSKKIATLIVGKMRGSSPREEEGDEDYSYKSSEPEENSEMDQSSAMKSAVRGIMSAFKDESEDGLMDAMQTFVELAFENIKKAEEDGYDDESEERNEMG